MALCGADLKSDPEVDTEEVTPPLVRLAACSGLGKYLGWCQANAQVSAVRVNPIAIILRRFRAATR